MTSSLLTPIMVPAPPQRCWGHNLSRRRRLQQGGLRTGDRALDFMLPDVEGRQVSLGETYRSGQNVLLVFLRHLG